MREGWTARLVRVCWSLLWLGLLLVGLPAALIRVAGWPLPDRLPAVAEVQRWAAQPLTTHMLVNVVVGLLWLLWAWLVYTVVAELLRWLTRLRLPRARWPAPLQSATSGLVGALVLALTGGGSSPPGAPAEPSAATQPQPGHGLASTRPAPSPSDTEPGGDEDKADGEVAGGEEADEAAVSGAVTGVDLPGGGWASGPLAEQVAAAAAMVWWQRRRRYLPGPPMLGGRRDDPDLLDLPATVAAIQHAVGGPADLPPPTMTSVVMPAHGPVWPWQLPPGGVGLIGPGAADAARGLLIAALLAANHSPGTGRLLITATDLHVLLGTSPGRYRDLPGLTVVDSIDEVLTHIAAHSSRAPAGDRRVGGPAEHGRPTDRTAPPLVVFLATAPDHRRRRRLTTLLAPLATPAPDTPVSTLAVLGAWPSGTSWRVDADGTIFTTTGEARVGGRLSVLPADAAIELLILLATLTVHGRPPAQLVDQWHAAQAVPGGIVSASSAGVDHRPAPVSAVVGLRSDGEAAADSGLRATIGPPLLWLRVLGVVELRQRTGGNGGYPGLGDMPAGDEPTDGERELRLPRSAALQIAVYLAAHPDGATGTALARAVWPGVPAPASRLRTTLSTLRIGLEQAAGQPVLRREGDRYRLDPDAIAVDLWRLQAAVDRAARAPTAHTRHAASREVVAAYTGDLAAGETWPWLPAHREAARRHVIDALSALASAASDQHTAIRLLHQAVGHDPDNEHLHRELMRAQAALGDCDGVAHTYRRLTRRLADHGTRPSTATSDLARRLTGDTLPAEDTTRR